MGYAVVEKQELKEASSHFKEAEDSDRNTKNTKQFSTTTDPIDGAGIDKYRECKRAQNILHAGH